MKSKKSVDLGFACLDMDRQRRRGFPEVVYCQFKTCGEILQIARHLSRDREAPLLLTRLDKKIFLKLKKAVPGLKYHARARVAYRYGLAQFSCRGEVLVVTGGTSDIPVAEEAALTCELMGSPVKRIYDVGVAGVHRILQKKKDLEKASCIIVAAGMEGALASLVSGLVKCPVVAVPTSCGYGSSFEGLAALLAMLNSCSPGIATVNIDNGFGAGYMAGLINRT